MKMVAKIMLLALLVGSAYAAVWTGLAPKKPTEFMEKEGCYINEINDVIPFDKTITPLGHCVRITCAGDEIYYASCGVVFSSNPNCHKVGTDLTKPYPECCPTYECDSENEIHE